MGDCVDYHNGLAHWDVNDRADWKEIYDWFVCISLIGKLYELSSDWFKENIFSDIFGSNDEDINVVYVPNII